MAVMYGLYLDPVFRTALPEEYPPDLTHWFAYLAFDLVFNQLFLVYAPCDWCLRLFRRPWVAASLTALFGMFVLGLNLQAHGAPASTSWMAVLLVSRATLGFLAVVFYLRGGVLLTWWWTLLLESRHLFNMGNH
jgi:hypothetical protein